MAPSRMAVVILVAALTWACGGATLPDDDGAGSSAQAGVFDLGPRCFAAEYGVEQLDARPLQTVSSLQVRLYATDAGKHLISLAITRKGAPEVWTSGGLCIKKKKYTACRDQCDVGTDLTMTSDGRLRLVNRGLHASPEPNCDESVLDAQPGADDVFELSPIPCPSVEAGCGGGMVCSVR